MPSDTELTQGRFCATRLSHLITETQGEKSCLYSDIEEDGPAPRRFSGCPRPRGHASHRPASNVHVPPLQLLSFPGFENPRLKNVGLDYEIWGAAPRLAGFWVLALK